MTRSAQSPAKTAKKAFREKTKAQGIPFPVAVQAAKQALIDSGKIEYPNSTRRNPGRMDSVQWNGDAFICPRVVDEHDLGSDIEDLEIEAYDTAPRHETIVSIDILKIAKPAKRKGVAKNFEVLRPLDRVIVLDDEDDFEDLDGSDWDVLSIYSDRDEAPKMSYSRAVRGQG